MGKRNRSDGSRRAQGQGKNGRKKGGKDKKVSVDAALARLVERALRGHLSIAGAFALGYCAVAMAQSDAEPDWYDDLDPLDLLVLGCAFPLRFRDAAEFGNSRVAWLRRLKVTAHQRDLETFVRLAVEVSAKRGLAVGHPTVFRSLVSCLEGAGLDRTRLPASLRLEALADARFLCGPSNDLPTEMPPSHAVAKSESFLSSLSIKNPDEDSCADRLADGLYLLESLGLPVKQEVGLLLPALYISVVASDDEPIPTIAERSEAWALGLDETSALVPIVDVMMVAAASDLDVVTAVAHLFALPEFGQAIRDEDRWWRSGPGLDFVRLAIDVGCREVVTDTRRVVRLGPVSSHMLANYRRDAEDELGRPLNPDDSLLQDPERATTAWASMLEFAGIHPAWRYAYLEGNAPFPKLDGTFSSKSDREEWRAAISNYLEVHPEAVEPDHRVEVARLRQFFAMLTLGEIMRDEGLSTRVVKILDSDDWVDPELEALVEFLISSEDLLRESYSGSLSMREHALRLARLWDGERLSARLGDDQMQVAATEGLDLAVLLVLAAAWVKEGVRAN